MTRLYAATGDAIARLDEGEIWTVELSLSGCGAQCLAVDPADPETCTPAYARAGCAAASTAAEPGSTALSLSSIPTARSTASKSA